jgi:hypothetical protein
LTAHNQAVLITSDDFIVLAQARFTQPLSGLAQLLLRRAKPAPKPLSAAVVATLKPRFPPRQPPRAVKHGSLWIGAPLLNCRLLDARLWLDSRLLLHGLLLLDHPVLILDDVVQGDIARAAFTGPPLPSFTPLTTTIPQLLS